MLMLCSLFIAVYLLIAMHVQHSFHFVLYGSIGFSVTKHSSEVNVTQEGVPPKFMDFFCGRNGCDVCNDGQAGLKE